MPNIGLTELVIILVIVIILFGVGRVSKIFGELGSGIRAFKDGLQGSEKDQSAHKSETEEKKESD